MKTHYIKYTTLKNHYFSLPVRETNFSNHYVGIYRDHILPLLIFKIYHTGTLVHNTIFWKYSYKSAYSKHAIFSIYTTKPRELNRKPTLTNSNWELNPKKRRNHAGWCILEGACQRRAACSFPCLTYMGMWRVRETI